MTATISRDLALAIGYAPESVRVGKFNLTKSLEDCCQVYRLDRFGVGKGADWTHWQWFSYSDPTVALPLLKWLMDDYSCSASKTSGGQQFCIYKIHRPTINIGVTLELAICNAVIALSKGKT